MFKYFKPSLFLLAHLLACTLSAPNTAAQDLIKVGVSKATKAKLYQEVPISGTVTALHRAHISAEVSGIIKKIAVDVGARVAAGDLLLELDRELGQIAYDSARAEKQQAQQALNESERVLSDARALAKQRNIADSEVEARISQVSIDKAALQAADAQMRLRAAELERHSLTAPFAGVISQRMVNLGQWITPGTPLVELVDTEDLRLDFQVPQRFFPLIDSNTQLQVSFDASAVVETQSTVTAEISGLVPATSAQGRSFLLIAKAPTEQHKLIAGMSVTGLLKISDGREGVTVHRDALIRYPDGRTIVWTLSSDEPRTAQMNNVTVGLAFDDRVEIVSGLQSGQSVIVEGNEAIREGQAVAASVRKQAGS